MLALSLLNDPLLDALAGRPLDEGAVRVERRQVKTVQESTQHAQLLPQGRAPAARRFLDYISNPVLTNIRIESKGVTLGNLEPSAFGDVFASRPLIVSGTWTGEPTGTIILRGIAGNGAPFEKQIDLSEAAARGLDHPALPVLWARERVRHLTEQAGKPDEAIREITSLGLSHSLLTPYTSFVAVNETPRETDQLAKTVKQPLPLPLGVTEAAVGSTGGCSMVSGASVPEPGAIGLISLLVVLLALQRER